MNINNNLANTYIKNKNTINNEQSCLTEQITKQYLNIENTYNLPTT